MQRVTLTLDDDLLHTIDELAKARGYNSRSEAVRDIVRNALASDKQNRVGPCVAALSYVYDHETRELARRLTNVQHEHHHLSIASMHVHLDHDSCLEISVMKGDAAQIERRGGGGHVPARCPVRQSASHSGGGAKRLSGPSS